VHKHRADMSSTPWLGVKQCVWEEKDRRSLSTEKISIHHRKTLCTQCVYVLLVWACYLPIHARGPCQYLALAPTSRKVAQLLFLFLFVLPIDLQLLIITT
jgi:hypothetical protein